MGVLKNLFKHEHVYAGPEPFKVEGVYAGPEALGGAGQDPLLQPTQPDPNAVEPAPCMPEPDPYLMEDVYAGPEQMGMQTPQAGDGATGFEPDMAPVYAGPDMMFQAPVNADELNAQLLRDGMMPPYPFNNADVPISDVPIQQFELTYAAPDAFARGEEMPWALVEDEPVPAPASVPEPTATGGGEGFCPTCGAPRTGGRFCAECGTAFPAAADAAAEDELSTDAPAGEES